MHSLTGYATLLRKSVFRVEAHANLVWACRAFGWVGLER